MDASGQKGIFNMKYMNKKLYNLQLFAEGDGNGSENSEAAKDANANSGNDDGTNEGKKTMSFDDFLASDGMQAEFDRRTQKAIKTAVENAQRKWQTLADDKLSEAEKLAHMTGEEKQKYRADKAEKELAALKKDIALRDMANTARTMLLDEKINVSDDVLKHLVSEDAETTKAAVQAFAAAYKEAVQAGVKEAIKGNAPKTGSGSGLTKEKIMKIKDRAERQRLIRENEDLWRKN